MKMHFSGRIILLVAGLALAWCALWGASVMKNWVVSLEPPDGAVPEWALVFIAFIVLVVGGILLVGFIRRIQQDTSFDDAGEVLTASLQLICFGFLFGAIVAPVGSGTGVGAWLTPWDFLLILGFLPTVFVVQDIITDIVRPRSEGIQAGDADVRAFKRRS